MPHQSVCARWQARQQPVIDIRQAVPADAAVFARLVDSISYGARYFRFGHGGRRLSPDYFVRLCTPELHRGHCLVALARTHATAVPTLAGSADYHFLEDRSECEMTILVAESWRGSPVAYRLLLRLIELARQDGLACMRARVMATNRRMLAFIQRNGFVRDPDEGGDAILHLSLALADVGCRQR